MKKTLLILMTLFTVVIGYSQTFIALDNNNNTLEYNITSANTVEVKDYIAGGTDIDIPSMVDNTVCTVTTTYTVTSIGVNAFRENQLTSVMIPNSVTNIGLYAFFINNLTSITIPNSVTSIGFYAFYSNLLTTITIPDSVITLGAGAFQLNQLISVTLPSSITSISAFLFSNNQLQSIIIPNSVTSIGDNAFTSNQLTNITIPNAVTSIGDSVFRYNPLTCVISESTTAPAITTGANDTFHISGDRSNIDLSIPSGTASVYVAAQWTGFNSVSEGLSGTFVVDHLTYQINGTPNNEVTVTDYNTAGGTVVDIPATVVSGCIEFSVTNIGNQVFQGDGLTSVIIPNSVTTIGVYAFFQNSLTDVIIPSGVTDIGLGVFETNLLTSVTIPNGVTNIGLGAFKNNSLTSITIPNTVTSISIQAFKNNPLADVISESIIPPTISTGGANDSFSSNRSNIHLHIPANTMGAYVTDPGALWTGFNPVTEDAALSVLDFELINEVIVVTTPNELNVISSGNSILENYTIYSITGAKVKVGTESNIVIETLSKGIYIIELTFDTGKLTKKFVK
ncbi:leucine-rich repeat domain-containing protein [Psychroserpens luteus]|uniref:Leucine-rich repeat domain-containing protein n=1 Tax=Psychroserpens luteus TaxID=1434066 RepID=A0ABW5ZQ52_9FLAO|nr:leucine-rich repeat domain-containing protein [Psychroserpens luteus]